MIKPMLFSTEMVQAILKDRKTVTRRVVKPQPKGGHTVLDYDDEAHTADILCGNGGQGGVFRDWAETVKAPCWIGDTLWVRETFRVDYLSNIPGAGRILYKDGTYMDIRFAPERYDMMRRAQRKPGWRPNENMPREAARIFLKVTDVRVEQLQDITESEAISEGVPDEWPMSPVYCPHCKGEGLVGAVHPVSLGYMEVECPYCEDTTVRFSNLWDSTIKPKDRNVYGWESNPWVWVIEFERCDKPEGFV